MVNAFKATGKHSRTVKRFILDQADEVAPYMVKKRKSRTKCKRARSGNRFILYEADEAMPRSLHKKKRLRVVFSSEEDDD
jgi:hypothetical protein